jgi:hypothetical protein
MLSCAGSHVERIVNWRDCGFKLESHAELSTTQRSSEPHHVRMERPPDSVPEQKRYYSKENPKWQRK